MPSSKAALAFAMALGVAGAWSSRANAQQAARGFAVERFYPSAPGGGWFVMDALDMRGELGGAIAISGGYAHAPLRVSTTGGGDRLALVSHQSFAAVAVAATYDRYRVYVDLTGPLAVGGDSGSVGGYALTAPSVQAGNDSFSDVRIGFDARLLGGATSAFRLGAGVQLLVPSGLADDYVTDETYRAMGRLLFAGDAGLFGYAGHVGVHLRSRDEGPTAGAPQGNELLFGVAAGPRFAVTADAQTVVVVGPEIFGATAFRSFLGTNATGLEALLSGRIEGAGEHRAQLRVKLGAGGGLNPHFGAPEWRMVLAIELFDRGLRTPPR